MKDVLEYVETYKITDHVSRNKWVEANAAFRKNIAEAMAEISAQVAA